MRKFSLIFFRQNYIPQPSWVARGTRNYHSQSLSWIWRLPIGNKGEQNAGWICCYNNKKFEGVLRSSQVLIIHQIFRTNPWSRCDYYHFRDKQSEQQRYYYMRVKRWRSQDSNFMVWLQGSTPSCRRSCSQPVCLSHQAASTITAHNGSEWCPHLSEVQMWHFLPAVVTACEKSRRTSKSD